MSPPNRERNPRLFCTPASPAPSSSPHSPPPAPYLPPSLAPVPISTPSASPASSLSLTYGPVPSVGRASVSSAAAPNISPPPSSAKTHPPSPLSPLLLPSPHRTYTPPPASRLTHLYTPYTPSAETLAHIPHILPTLLSYHISGKCSPFPKCCNFYNIHKLPSPVRHTPYTYEVPPGLARFPRMSFLQHLA